ncbi:cytochrome P450 4F2-like [Saccostrea echinata]|uniref:cytochrome P450 4F2-like n=1 Tax=Saccostrea echinata TaxID=191078 RepID=UPI002A7EB665|nr:cytochrome P450 4F2-like [Saccostrea echinata]
MILLTLLFGTLVYSIILIVQHVHRYNQWSKVTAKITSFEPWHPLWGHLHLVNDMADFFRLVFVTVEKTRAKLLGGWVMFLYPVFSTCHPDTAKILLKSSEPKVKYNLGGVYRMILPWLGDGLLLSDGRKWERNRRLLTPAFHFDILRPYVQIYNDVANIFLKKLQKACDSKEVIEIYSHVSLATLDTMLRCSLSYTGQVQEKGDSHPYVQAVRRLGYLSVQRTLSPWLYPDVLFWLSPSGREYKRLIDYVHEFADEIIASRRKALMSKDASERSGRKLDFLDILITAKDENGEGLNDQDIRAEVDTFLFEGHDTTASAISWAIYCLAKYPEEQEKIYQEVTSVLDGRPQVTWEDLNQLKYTAMFLKEVLRMHSPVPFISRWLTKPLVLDGVEIPAHFQVDILIHAINHHPDVWPDHMEFRPSRFEDETRQERDPYTYIPFSAGSRNCIGQNFAVNEEKVMISALVKRFKMELVDGHVYEEYPEVVMRAKYGIKIKVTKR